MPFNSYSDTVHITNRTAFSILRHRCNISVSQLCTAPHRLSLFAYMQKIFILLSLCHDKVKSSHKKASRARVARTILIIGKKICESEIPAG